MWNAISVVIFRVDVEHREHAAVAVTRQNSSINFSARPRGGFGARLVEARRSVGEGVKCCHACRQRFVFTLDPQCRHLKWGPRVCVGGDDVWHTQRAM